MPKAAVPKIDLRISLAISFYCKLSESEPKSKLLKVKIKTFCMMMCDLLGPISHRFD
jgi:hypothetical protein